MMTLTYVFNKTRAGIDCDLCGCKVQNPDKHALFHSRREEQGTRANPSHKNQLVITVTDGKTYRQSRG